MSRVKYGSVYKLINMLDSWSCYCTVLWERWAVWTSPLWCSVAVQSWALKSRSCSNCTTTALTMSWSTRTSSWIFCTTSAPPPVTVSPSTEDLPVSTRGPVNMTINHSQISRNMDDDSGLSKCVSFYLLFVRYRPSFSSWIRWHSGNQGPHPVWR